MTATFDLAVFAADCVGRGLSKAQAKVELERLGHGHLRSELSPAMRAIAGEAKPRPNYAQRQAAKRLEGATILTDEMLAAIDAAYAACHDALTAAGAVLDNESDSGSRYYTLAGRAIRVSDHDANGATADWIERNEVEEIRVDRRGWRSALETIIGE